MKCQQKYILDFFVSIVDNYGDMGFVCEYIQAVYRLYPDTFDCNIWVNNVSFCELFVRQFGLNCIKIGDIGDFGKLRKSAIGISMLHAPIPDLDKFDYRAMILRIDYISFDPRWIEKNETQHISSTQDRQIIELIPSTHPNSAGLIPILDHGVSTKEKYNSHITIFCYNESLDIFDFDSFPLDKTVYIFSSRKFEQENIVSLDFLNFNEFYHLLDTSEFVIIRGEVSFAHIIQSGVPFLWDMYKGIGGFPEEQSSQFLTTLGAQQSYIDLHYILNNKKTGVLSYTHIVETLSHTCFGAFKAKNLIHTTKKYIDRFNNSI